MCVYCAVMCTRISVSLCVFVCVRMRCVSVNARMWVWACASVLCVRCVSAVCVACLLIGNFAAKKEKAGWHVAFYKRVRNKYDNNYKVKKERRKSISRKVNILIWYFLSKYIRFRWDLLPVYPKLRVAPVIITDTAGNPHEVTCAKICCHLGSTILGKVTICAISIACHPHLVWEE